MISHVVLASQIFSVLKILAKAIFLEDQVEMAMVSIVSYKINVN